MTPVPLVYLSSTLAALAPSSGADTTRLCQGCARPTGRLPGQTAPSFTAPAAARTTVVVSHPHSNNKRLMAHGHVIEHERDVPAGQHVGKAQLSETVAVVPVEAAAQCAL